jgi:hypothetical protein
MAGAGSDVRSSNRSSPSAFTSVASVVIASRRSVESPSWSPTIFVRIGAAAASLIAARPRIASMTTARSARRCSTIWRSSVFACVAL